ncbi:MAG: OsmC family peroxiredoxin [Thermoleophilia bacterium]
MAIEREATATWEGNLARGVGRLSAASSVGFNGLAFSLPTRIGQPGDETSPEELLAAAHAGCYAMALASVLTNAEVPPGRLDVSCRITLDEDHEQGFRIVRSALLVEADVDGVSRDALRAAMDAADQACPYSALLRDAGATVETAIKR